MVALGLAVIGTEDPHDKSAPTTTSKATSMALTLQDFVQTADVTKLRSALITVADSFPQARDLINSMLNTELFRSEMAILKAAKNYLRPVRNARNWSRSEEAQLFAQEQLMSMADAVPDSEESVKGLIGAAQYIYKELTSIDDSNGTLSEACYSLTRRAVEIVNSHHEFQPVLITGLSVSSDLPLSSFILAYGDHFIAEHFIGRLEKHLLKRDDELGFVTKDDAVNLLINHYAETGDVRILELLAENKVHENIKSHALLRYYEARGEWQEIVDRLWKLKDTYPQKSLLKRALSETKQYDKLLDLQLQDTLRSENIKHELVKIKHLLNQSGNIDQLPQIIEQLIDNSQLSLSQRVELLNDQERYPEIAQLLREVLDLREDQLAWNHWSTVTHLVASLTRQLQEVAPMVSIPVWRELFKREAENVGHISNYLTFQEYGTTLLKLGEAEIVQDMAKSIISKYPTRKKLVTICRSWI